MLFEVAVLEKPTKKAAEEGASERLVLGPTAVCARDAQAATVLAGRLVGEGVSVDRLEVLVRPFVRG